jgi:hypothetical protein
MPVGVCVLVHVWQHSRGQRDGVRGLKLEGECMYEVWGVEGIPHAHTGRQTQAGLGVNFTIQCAGCSCCFLLHIHTPGGGPYGG